MYRTPQALHVTVVGLSLLLGAGSLSRPAQAETYYAALRSDNKGDCHAAQRDDTPIETIRQGIGCLQKAGDTLYIREGTYHESIDDTQVTIPSGTDWNTPVTIASYPGETATLMGRVSIREQKIAYVIFDRLTVDGGGSPENRSQTFTVLQFAFQSHLKFQNGEIRNANDQLITGGQGGDLHIVNNHIHGAYPFFDPNRWPQCKHLGCADPGGQGCPCTTGAYCFYFNAHDSFIEGNVIHDCSSWAFHQYWGGGNNIDNNVIQGNVFYNNAYDDGQRGSKGHDIIVAKGSNTRVYNNIIYGSTSPLHEAAIVTKNRQDQIYNNTIYNVHGLGIYLYPGSQGTVVRNNIIYQTSDTPILDQGSGTIYCPGEKPDCNVTGVDPRFVNASAADFRLQASSPAIQAGVPMAGLTYTGASPDAGALEAGSGVQPLPAPRNLRLVTLP